jgi:trimeric autotransporter adhesin
MTKTHDIITCQSRTRRYTVAPVVLAVVIVAFTRQAVSQSASAVAPPQSRVTINDGQSQWPYDGPQFGLTHSTGSGLGFDRNFTTVDAFVPLFDIQDGIAFGDFRGLLESDLGPRGVNIGFGRRSYNPTFNGIVGYYLYYDYRETETAFFQQLSPGFELLKDGWEFRVNGYIPAIFGDRKSIDNRFFENSLLIDRAEVAYSGVDAEIGLAVPVLSQFETRVFGGGYYFNASNDKPVSGWKTRVESRVSDFLTVGVSIQQDDVFDTTVNATVALRFPGNGILDLFRDSNAFAPRGLMDRLTDRVQRLQNIVVDQDDGVKALNSTGEPLFFLHLSDRGDAPKLDGSVEFPYSELDQALTDRRYTNGTADIIYVRQACSPAITHEGNIVLQPNTQLLSNRAVQNVKTQLGVQRLPFSGMYFGVGALRMCAPGQAQSVVLDFANGDRSTIVESVEQYPRIDGNVILNNNTTIAGFEVLGTITNAGQDIRGFAIRDNILRNDRLPNDQDSTLPPKAGILLTGNVVGSIEGNIGVGVNRSNGNPIPSQDGLVLDNAEFDGDISDNTFTNYINSGVSIQSSSFSGEFSRNNLTSNSDGLTINNSTFTGEIRQNGFNSLTGLVVEDGSRVDADILANSFQDNQVAILIRNANLRGNIGANQFRRHNTGIQLDRNGSLVGDVRDNLFENSNDSGILIRDFKLTGDVVANNFRRNRVAGIYFDRGSVLGDIRDNLFEDSLAGISIQDFQLTGAIAANQFRRNTVAGIEFGDSGLVVGDIRDNQFTDNSIGIKSLNGSVVGRSIQNNLFLRSSQAAVQLNFTTPSSSLEFLNNRFLDNNISGGSDVIMEHDNDGTLRLLFDGNSSNNFVALNALNYKLIETSGPISLFPQTNGMFSGNNVGSIRIVRE